MVSFCSRGLGNYTEYICKVKLVDKYDVLQVILTFSPEDITK